MAQTYSVQDIATWSQIALSIVTIGVLVFTWRAATAQAQAAQAQAEAARRLILVTEAQRLSSEQASASLIGVTDAQRRAAENSAEAVKEQNALIKAQIEESLRPLLVYEQGGGPMTQLPCTLTNQGSGMALDILWWYGRADAYPKFPEPISATILGTGRSARITVNMSKAQSSSITIQYRSSDGRGYQTFVSLVDGRPEQVQHLM